MAVVRGACIDERAGAVNALRKHERMLLRLCDDAVGVVAAVLVDVLDGLRNAADDFNCHPEDGRRKLLAMRIED